MQIKPLVNIIKIIFGNRQTRSRLLKEYDALLIEYEKLQTENTALKERLTGSGIPSPNEAIGEMSLDEAAVAQIIAEPLAIDAFKSDAPIQISLDISNSISDGEIQSQSIQPSIEPPPLIQINDASPNKEKVELFLSLFVGRKEYFAKYYFNKKTNSGAYTPVCENEWDEHYCNKRTKEHAGAGKSLCAQCRHPDYTPFDAYAVSKHLRGYVEDSKGRREEFIAGIYPLLDENVCRFIAVDFDAHNAESGASPNAVIDDVKLFIKACRENDVPVYLERSRSGNGFHAWVFFSEPVTAASARKMGSGLITYAMEHFGRMSFKSYDRLFPNQDILPKGGFGNLIALPLQREARKSGNTTFLDENLTQIEDQWEYLSSVRRMTQGAVDEVVSKICDSSDGLGDMVSGDAGEEKQEPWEKRRKPYPLVKQDFHSTLEIIYANMVFIPKDSLSVKAANRIRRLAVIKNPEFGKNQRMRLPVNKIPRTISSVYEDGEYIGIPRGLLSDLKELLDSSGAKYHMTDKRNSGNKIKVSFLGQLKDEQQSAADTLLGHENGVLHGATAFGKTVVGDYLIAERNVNTLIIVHNEKLLEVWKNSVGKFLTLDHVLPESETKRGRSKKRELVGTLGGGKDTLNGIVDIAIYKSLLEGERVKDFVKDYGMVLVDECHHVGAFSYEQVLNHVNAKWVYGFTATPIRSDGLDALIFFSCGPIRFSTNTKALMAGHGFDHIMVPRFTSLNPILLTSFNNIPTIHTDLVNTDGRNRMIVNDVIAALREGRTPLVLTERVEHVNVLADVLESETENIEIIRLYGGLSRKEKRIEQERLSSLPVERCFAIIATSRYIGEGFDLPALDTLFLAMPIKWKGRLEQYIGRLHREKEGKTEARVYDYIDVQVPVLERMYRVRLRGYASFGYTVRADLNAAENIGMIYDAGNYQRTLTMDLEDAVKQITVSGPKVSKAKSDIIQGFLQAKDVSCEILRSDLRFIIIDRRIVWYGDINFFGVSEGNETCLRIENREIAEELLGFSNKPVQYTISGLQNS